MKYFYNEHLKRAWPQSALFWWALAVAAFVLLYLEINNLIYWMWALCHVIFKLFGS